MMSPEKLSEKVAIKFEARCMHVAPRRMRIASRRDRVRWMPMPVERKSVPEPMPARSVY